MHTYRKSRNEPLWTVGVWVPADEGTRVDLRWHAIRDFNTELAAATFTSFLNGGEPPHLNWLVTEGLSL